MDEGKTGSRPPSELVERARKALIDCGGDDTELDLFRVELELQHEELQRAHAELVASHARFRGLFDDAPVALLELDALCRIRQTNGLARRLLGEHRGTAIAVLAAEGHANRLLGLATRAGTVGRAGPEDVALRGVDGTLLARVTCRRGADDATLVMVEDVTEIRRVHARLEESERQLRSLIETLPDSIAVVRDHEVAFANRALARLLHRREPTLRGERLVDVIPELAVVLDHPDLAHGAARAELELRIDAGKRLDRRTVEAHAFRIDFRGAPAKLLVLRDLTERRRLEARMSHAERLATIGMLVAGVTHEISNPLTYVLGNLSELLDEVRDPEHRTRLNEALVGAKRIATIARDLRSFHMTSGVDDAVDLNELASEAVRTARLTAGERATLHLDAGIVRTTQTDGGRLAQVLLNLVLNAIHAMPDRPGKHNHVRVRTWADGDDLCVAVEDNGVGIAADALPHIFDPFFTTRREKGGTGLGLAISNNIVQRLGGFIEVTSSPGSGSCFTVRLPWRDPARAPTPLSSQRTPAPGPAGLRVLVVDDDPDLLGSLARGLARLGEIETAPSGNAAIARLAASTYDIILSDLVMGDGTGVELAMWIERNQPEHLSRLVFMSGMAHPAVGTYGDVPRIDKPFTAAELSARLLEIARPASR